MDASKLKKIIIICNFSPTLAQEMCGYVLKLNPKLFVFEPKVESWSLNK